MGVDSRRPPLPAPTETETETDTNLRDDTATNLSTRTDKTSYSIPADGTPITLDTLKTGGLHKKHPSQTSLLIEYFEESGKGGPHVKPKPSVRVRVTPSSRKSKSTSKGHVQITETSRTARKPSYTRRISLGNTRDHGPQPTDTSYSEGSNVSSLPPVEIEVLQHGSDVSSNGGRIIPLTSDVSSMPPDSMLGTSTPAILPPGRHRSRSLEREEVAQSMAQDTLKAPTKQRSRSMSKERITQRVMEKLQQKPADSSSSKSRTSRTSREELSATRKSRRRTSKGSRDEEVSAISGTESSLLSSNANRRSGDTQSMRSGVSGTSSINNPKLLATVEDAIKRLILPEINALKEEQRVQSKRDKFDRVSRDSQYEVESTSSREHSRRRVSKSSSAPHMHGTKPKVVLNREGHDPETIFSSNSSKKDRRSSRGSVSERSHAESTREEKHRRCSKDKESHSARDAALVGLGAAGLTAAALKSHNSRESSKEDRRERRKHRDKGSRSRTASISESVDDEHYAEEELVPPLPVLQSELHGSELTRDSILSAETETKERPSSQSSRGTGSEPQLREVARGYASPGTRTPTRTPVALNRSLGTAQSNKSHTEIGLQTPKSDRSYSSRSKDASAAGLEAAAAAKARALESTETPQSKYEIAESTPTRELSPIQSESSYREEVAATGSPRHLRSIHSGASMSSAGRKMGRPESSLSIQSFESSPSTKAARTRKRPQGINLERDKEVLGEPDTPRDVDQFFEQNHEENEAYRRQLEHSASGSPSLEYQHTSNLTEESGDGHYLGSREDQGSFDQAIRKVGSNPEYVHTPIAVESAVASLHEPSNISVRSSVSSPLKKSRLSQVSPSPGAAYTAAQHEQLQEHPSKARWSQIRDQAQTMVEQSQNSNSPRQSLSRSINNRSMDESPKMQANAFPTHGDFMPEIGYGVDDESEVDTNPSIIQGPLGGDMYRDEKGDKLNQHDDYEQVHSPQTYGKAAAVGAGAAGAAAIAAAAAARVRDDNTPSAQGERRKATVEDDYEGYPGEQAYAPPPLNYGQKDRTPSRSPALWKDEGYMSANQPGGITPDPRGRSKLFDDDGMGDYDEEGLGGGDVFATNKHNRHLSGNSHGMSSPLYDSATGKGMDKIMSKDVVALMDHLTVRDAQRNARDTEILVTLVRSAAETRNELEGLKQFIRTQDAMIMNQNDKRADLTEQRILQGPRPQPLGSPRVPRSSTEDFNDAEQKKKSVFKRAIRGLGMKGDKDIKNIEAMLVQLLGEVEGLKEAHTLSLAQQANSNSLTSYENLRASGGAGSGYEPSGRAGTADSPNQSGYLSNPSSRRVPDMPTGYEVHQPHRISTVEEDDEEYAEDEGDYENTERMTTPTQEARRHNSASEALSPQQTRGAYRDSQSQENTPKRSKHKSNSSSIFGIPKISRWSKTTASTNVESLPRNSGSGEYPPYPSASRSGSQVNVAYYPEGDYEVADDDRFRSTESLARDDQRSLDQRSIDQRSIDGRSMIRSPSPLIPEGHDQFVLDDPKYQAHRNSLNLQHPQPRPGPTGRHQSHLESQAQIFDPAIRSPDFDQWGSNPSLARNRLSGAGQMPGNLSPISSEGGLSQHSAAEQAAPPPRPPKIREDGPLIPQQQPLAGHGQTRQMYSAQNEFGTNSQGALTPLAPIQEVRYSLETDRGHHYSPTPSPRPSQNLSAMASPQRKITGPRPMGSRSPQPGMSAQAPLEHSNTVVRRKPVADRADTESLESYRSSLDSEIF